MARNAAQRSLMGDAGPWGATLVRFLFGLPFSIVFVALGYALVHPKVPAFGTAFFLWAALGAAMQILATAALLTAMRRSSFALGTAFQQSGLPFAAIIGFLVFSDHLRPLAWVGIALVTAALTVLSWPPPATVDAPSRLSGAGLGLLSGLGFAISANSFRQAALALDHAHPIVSALTTVAVVQALQSAGLSTWMALRDRPALLAAVRAWRMSLGAGFFGAAASALWFSALALSPAGPVRVVGVVEMPFAAIAGRRLFAERLTALQWAAGAAAAIGVMLAALG